MLLDEVLALPSHMLVGKAFFGMSDSLTNLLVPTTSSISVLNLFNILGLFIISAMVHCIATEDVSVPARKMSLHLHKQVQ